MTDAAGSETWIQYNADGTNFGASGNFTWDDGSKALVIEGTVNAIDATGNQFYMDGGVIFMWAGGTAEMAEGGGHVACQDYVELYDSTGTAHVTVAGGGVTAVDNSTAGFAMSDGTATFNSGNIDPTIYGSLTVDSDTGSLTVNANSVEASTFIVYGGSGGATMAIGQWDEDELLWNNVIRDVPFEFYVPGFGWVAAQSLQDAAEDYLVLFDGEAKLSAGAGDEQLQIILSAGTGININGNAIGFFATTPSAQRTSTGALTSESIGTNATYMLQTVYDAMRAYGLLT